ncbi:Ribosome recycling factor [Marinobacterium lacunae]|uniref:Ribosome-recycling factor n=1 Tax=Marinobacterium lacunae TaxID=1232683 RepID=A0A081G0R9_9GAMM|nr:ribosome recycling factor [Marinobacterium lacunae]KEA64374.1 Ribosome recycling factor [Marinobacterium lacunae]MBR9884520.1 ribosome recycling factor [Oceanospirillales bacterium]
MIREIVSDAEGRMKKSIESLTEQFKKIRTGRATPAILDAVQVSYYGSMVPVQQVANITVEDARTLMINPWEKKMVPEIEKAIMKSDLGLNPATSGDVIRVPMPALTEETRKGYIRQARLEAENARVAIRNIRRDANGDFKDLLKEKEITEDENRRGEDQIQKITDKYVGEVDALLAQKETDLMEI